MTSAIKNDRSQSIPKHLRHAQDHESRFIFEDVVKTTRMESKSTSNDLTLLLKSRKFFACHSRFITNVASGENETRAITRDVAQQRVADGHACLPSLAPKHLPPRGL